jgi:hypothetical protein
MKKSLSALMIIIFLFNIGGDYFLFYSFRYNIQKEVESQISSGIKDSELSVIEVSSKNESEIIWIRLEKEFRYKNEMYDVAKIKIQNHHKYLYCFKDIKENQLIANFIKSFDSKKEAQKKIKHNIDSNYDLQKLSTTVNFDFQILKPSRKTSLYKSQVFDIKQPPPRLT